MGLAAERIDVVQSLSAVVDSLPIEINSLSLTDAGKVVVQRPPRPSDFVFECDGVLFNVALKPYQDGTHCRFWAELGHLPFSLESAARRRNIMAILAHARGLPRVRFTVGNGQTIVLLAETVVQDRLTPPVLMHETVQVIQEARPYIRLLAEHL